LPLRDDLAAVADEDLLWQDLRQVLDKARVRPRPHCNWAVHPEPSVAGLPERGPCCELAL
jgi:hypothetical protein